MRRLLIASAAIAALAAAACIDKPAPTEAIGRSTVRLDLAPALSQHAGAAASKITVAVAYQRIDSTGKTTGKLITGQTLDAKPGTQPISLRVDLKECLADDSRTGPRD